MKVGDLTLCWLIEREEYVLGRIYRVNKGRKSEDIYVGEIEDTGNKWTSVCNYRIGNYWPENAINIVCMRPDEDQVLQAQILALSRDHYFTSYVCPKLNKKRLADEAADLAEQEAEDALRLESNNVMP